MNDIKHLFKNWYAQDIDQENSFKLSDNICGRIIENRILNF